MSTGLPDFTETALTLKDIFVVAMISSVSNWPNDGKIRNRPPFCRICAKTGFSTFARRPFHILSVFFRLSKRRRDLVASSNAGGQRTSPFLSFSCWAR